MRNSKPNKEVTFNCEFCGKEHHQPTGNYNRHEHHFCSQSCATNYRWKEQIKINEQLLNEIVECACGCGEKLYKYVPQGKLGGLRERKYVNGHIGNISNSGNFSKGHVPANKGLTWTDEQRIRFSCAQQGIEVSEFKGFISPLRPIEMSKLQYREWRLKVFSRDNFTCQKCGTSTKNLNAHHIQKWSKFPELRYDINNGITLCKECHKQEHKK